MTSQERYPVTLTRDDNDTILVTFPDVPEAVTYGNTSQEALARAADALLTAFDACMKDKRDIPSPSPVKGAPFVDISALESAKIALYRAMREGHVTKAELARRLDWHMPQIDRVLQVRHASRLDQLEAAFAALGKRLEVKVVDAQAVPGGSDVVASRRSRVPRRVAVRSRVLSARPRTRRAGRGRASADRSSVVRNTAKKR